MVLEAYNTVATNYQKGLIVELAGVIVGPGSIALMLILLPFANSNEVTRKFISNKSELFSVFALIACFLLSYIIERAGTAIGILAFKYEKDDEWKACLSKAKRDEPERFGYISRLVITTKIELAFLVPSFFCKCLDYLCYQRH